MSRPFTVFEVSWEICNKVGGIHTVLTTRAKTLVERFGDEYVAIGPWLLSDTDREVPFDDETGFEDFTEACREMGVPVRVGRWRIPSQPRTILVEFSSLYDQKDAILSGLWEDYNVDSIAGAWDYVEPVLFGHASALVIEKWWEEFVSPVRRRAVVHANEWMTGSCLLYLKKHLPAAGTIFTTHATMLGRALSSLGHSPDDGLGDLSARELAEEHNVTAKHSIEGTCAREADCFTTVSEITAKEAMLLHERAATTCPNGIDLDVIDELAGSTSRAKARELLAHVTSRFLGDDISDATFLCISGRYEYHNKGIDLLVDAMNQMNARQGKRVVLFILVPSGNSGVISDLLERLENPEAAAEGSLGLSTHNLFEAENDPVHEHCAHLGFENRPGARVQIVQVPIYLSERDGFLNLPYEAVLRAMDLTCFPSYYEPWGYTPQESLAVGVPTITSDYAGFGRWASSQGLGPENGITILPRVRVEFATVAQNLVEMLEDFLVKQPAHETISAACRQTASMTAWSGLITHYEKAYDLALAKVQERLESGVAQSRRRRREVKVVEVGQKPRLFAFDVSARLPQELRGLSRLSRNFWWCWDPEAMGLFEEISPVQWEACDHNAVLFLQRVYPQDLQRCAEDAGFIARLDRIVARFDAYVAEDRDRSSCPHQELQPEHPVAYFSAEFALHESLRIYSGGLGVLAGDHLKSASDLDLPLVALGLFYRLGYMSQRVSPSGEQIALDLENLPRSLPVRPVRDPGGEPLEISVPFPGRDLFVRAWEVKVGRVSLYLLDTNTPSNREKDREITRNLYGGESETRIQQEIVLGRGGVRLLRALGIQPAVCHMNEGHAAFMTLERIGHLTHKEGLTVEEAREFVRATTLFTTHTPVPAGHDRFDEDLMRRYFSDVADWVGVPWDRFYAIGRDDDGDFNMTHLGLYYASFINGVSKLHGAVSRQLLHSYWPALVQDEVPVGSVTNGIHLGTWTNPELSRLLGAPDRPPVAADFRDFSARVEPQAFFDTKLELKRRMLERVRIILRRSFVERDDSPVIMNDMIAGLRDDAIYIVYARRFAPYKRAALIFEDLERLAKILANEERPVRILVAGKAHPRDQHGKDILQGIVQASREEPLIGKVFFLEDYDVDLARCLVHGADVWLNNPTRLLEASGTSGMKAAANGCLNLSISDGWWPEGFDGENGWTIGGENRAYANQELQNQLDANALYRLLEEELVPQFFERDKQGISQSWFDRVRRNFETLPPVFNTDRMVSEYAERAYTDLSRSFFALTDKRRFELRERVRKKTRLRKAFPSVQILSIQVADLTDMKVGDPVDVRVEVQLASLTPGDVAVEMVLGHEAPDGGLVNRELIPLTMIEESADNAFVYEGSKPLEGSGRYGYGVRVRGLTDSDPADALRDLVLWA